MLAKLEALATLAPTEYQEIPTLLHVQKQTGAFAPIAICEAKAASFNAKSIVQTQIYSIYSIAQFEQQVHHDGLAASWFKQHAANLRRGKRRMGHEN